MKDESYLENYLFSRWQAEKVSFLINLTIGKDITLSIILQLYSKIVPGLFKKLYC